MSKEKVIEYIMNSPYNTNRQVLEGLLDSIGGEEYAILLEETVTTTQAEGESAAFEAEGGLAFAELINANNIKVTFDEVVYECAVHEVQSLDGSVYLYGGLGDGDEIDFSKCPFILQSMIYSDEQAHNLLLTETSGTHSIKIEVPKDDGASQNDWSTAEVTFINTGEGFYKIICPNTTSNGLEDENLTVKSHEQISVNVPLYKNRYIFNNLFNFINSNSQPVVTGNIQIGGSAFDGFEITGDGTISHEGIGREL